MNRTSRAALLLASLFVASCANSKPISTSATVAPSQPAPNSNEATPAWADTKWLATAGRNFVIRYRLLPDPIPSNESFALVAWVFAKGDAKTPLADVELSVDAAMPAHHHGMTRTPKIEKRADGSFAASGLLFHMPGHWELYFDVARGALTERAELDVELE